MSWRYTSHFLSISSFRPEGSAVKIQLIGRGAYPKAKQGQGLQRTKKPLSYEVEPVALLPAELKPIRASEPPKRISIPAYRYTWAQEAISIGFKPSKERRSETDSITLDPNPTCVRGLARIPFAGSEPSPYCESASGKDFL